MQELVEKIKCNNMEQLREREKYYILNNDCINKKIPNRTKKEYNKDNKEHFNEYHKNYGSQKITCECGCEIKKWSLSRHKKTPKHINLLQNF